MEYLSMFSYFYRNIGAKTPLSPANIFLGVGSDEAIDLIIRIACNPRIDSIIITPPTYGMYEVCANIHDVNIISVPLVREEPGNNPLGLKEGLPLPAFHIDPHQVCF
jgi:histidinol-phosphate aminotransferase